MLVWISVQPLIRLFLCGACGFVITKAGLFSPTAAVGTGQITLNITFPMLIFSKIVPAFNSQSISSLGPLFLVAILYEAIGLIMSWIIKQLFWVPHRFRYGLLVAGGWANTGDIPTAVVMSLMASAPFSLCACLHYNAFHPWGYTMDSDGLRGGRHRGYRGSGKLAHEAEKYCNDIRKSR
ncbi:hypothetical protein SCLCIDRAFT_1221571 [Scleroderma citrinum Foug A]|uniref:Auxin efflux carrier n=1 Tax=Scleroderma citrinum Foug A TaxID=1036808 RepID=A0A0C3DFU0_9AGAM|nr:hypothetical protein SCLCIDRAFT_1221571 [Scleroderma citrinum Foug A]